MSTAVFQDRLRRADALFVLAIALSAHASAGGSADLAPSDPALLNTTGAADAGSDQSPAIATTSDGVAVAVWDTNDTFGGTIPVTGNGRNIAIARSSDDGETWTAPFALTTSGSRQSSSPSIATDGEGVWVIVFASRIATGSDGIRQDIFYSLSVDDAITWSSPEPLDAAYAASSTGEEQAPSIVSLGDGEWVVAWESESDLNINGVLIGPDSDILISRSEDDAGSWSSPTPLRLGYAAGDNGDDSAVHLATDGQGRIVAVWSSTDTLARFNETNLGTDSDVLVARSSSRGINWSFPSPLNSYAAIDPNSDTAPAIATDLMGAWIAVWQSAYGGPGNVYGQDLDLWTSVSVKEGDLWSESSPLVPSYAQTSANDTAPALGTDTLGNWVVVWASRNPLGVNGQPAIGEDDDVLVSFSNTAGVVWSDPAPLNTNAGSDGLASDDATAIGVDRSGRWIVPWVSDNPTFGGSDNDLLYSRFLSPVVEVFWQTPSGGVFGEESNWDAGRVPGPFDRAAFDDTAVPQSLNQSYTVVVNQEVVTGRLVVRTGQVSLNLQESYFLDAAASEASQPPLLVGEIPELPPVSLRIFNSIGTTGDGTSLMTEAAAVARQLGSTATLEADGAGVQLDITAGPTVVGERGQGTLRALDSARLTTSGDIVLGQFSGSSGRIELRDTGTLMGFGGESGKPARIIVGQEGEGAWVIGNPAEPARRPQALQAPGAPIEEILIAESSGATGMLQIAGSQSLLSTSAMRFIVGSHGVGTLTIEQGGMLDTNSLELVGLAEHEGSSARVDIRDAGSRWFETSQAINVGLQGSAVLTVADGATIRTNSSVNVLRNGTFVGDGRVVGQLQNTGVVRPGAPLPGVAVAGDFGVLTVEGRYTQLGQALSGLANSGSLVLRIGGPERGTEYDALDVVGDASLGGGLFVTIDPGYASQGGPAIGEQFTLLSATQRDPNQAIFDVAAVPGFADNRLLRVDYVGGEVLLEVSTLGRVLGFAEPEDPQAIDGAPAGVVIANFDRDPQGLPDLVVPVVGATNTLYVLVNRGNDAKTNEWLGFEVRTQALNPADGAPIGLVVGDFSQNGFADDLAIAFDNGDSGRVRFFSNLDAQPGLFQSTVTVYPIPATPRDLAAGDLNNDGLVDVAIVSYNDSRGDEDPGVDRLLAQPLAVHQMAPRIVLPSAGRPESVDIDDLDNDKDLLLGPIAEADIVIGDGGLGAFVVLRNDGVGGFGGEPIILDAGGADINESTLADLNDDGFIDIVGLSEAQGIAVIVINRPTPGEFAPAVPLTIGVNARSLIVADLGGSEAVDLAAITDAETPGMRVIRTLRGDTSADAITFSTGPEYAADSNALLLGVADVNGGEGADLVVLGGPDNLRGLGSASTLLNAECAGDANGDGEVGFSDLNAVLSNFGQSGASVFGDVNLSGAVDFSDLNAVLGNYGRRCR